MFERKRTIAAGAAATLLVFGAGGAVAASTHGGPGGTTFVGRHAGELDAAASFLGLTAPALKAQLVAGNTLAQVASDRNKSVADLVATMQAAEVKRLDAAVAAGKLSAAREATIVAGLTRRLTDLVNRTNPLDRGGPRRAGELGVVSSSFGLTFARVWRQ